MGGALLECAAVIFSVVMVRSNAFSKIIAYVGILANGLDLAHFIMNLAFVPAIGVPLLAIGGTLELIWFILLGIRLYRLNQGGLRENH